VDSGVRWIGSIPQSWQVTTLGRCASVRSGITLGKTYPTEKELVDVPYLRVANVQNGYIDISDLAILSVTQAEAENTNCHWMRLNDGRR
jgi:type I restriction enzyme S subunit